MNFSMQTKNWYHNELFFFEFIMYCTVIISMFHRLSYGDIALRFILFSPIGFFIGYAFSRINHNKLELEGNAVILNGEEAFYLNQVEKVYFGNYSYIQTFEEKDNLNPKKLKKFHVGEQLHITRFYENGSNAGKETPYLVFKEGEHLRGINVSGFPHDKVKEFFSILEKRQIPIEINKKSFKKLL